MVRLLNHRKLQRRSFQTEAQLNISQITSETSYYSLTSSLFSLQIQLLLSKVVQRFYASFACKLLKKVSYFWTSDNCYNTTVSGMVSIIFGRSQMGFLSIYLDIIEFQKFMKLQHCINGPSINGGSVACQKPFTDERRNQFQKSKLNFFPKNSLLI